MGAKLFPRAFRAVRNGVKTRGNKRLWSVKAYLDLWCVIKNFQEAGLSVEQAAKIVAEHGLLTGQRSGHQSLVQRYYEAERLVARLKQDALTPFEALDVAVFLNGDAAADSR